MAKMFCIVPMSGGSPVVDQEATPFTGYVCIDSFGGYGAYLFSGTPAQLLALDAVPGVIGIVGVTESGTVKWAELNGVITNPVRTKINAFLTSKGITNIPAGWTYRQVVDALFKRFNVNFDLGSIDIVEGS